MTLMRSRRAALRLLTLLGLLAVPARAAEPIFPPAGAVGLVPPPGMVLAKTFAGFEHRSGASIVIVEMPAEAYGQLVATFTPDALRAKGFRAEGGSEGLPVAGGEGQVLRGSQAANGVTYAKWVAVVRGGAGTGLVTVQVPESARREVPDRAVEAALETIAFRSPGSVDDQIAALPYTVGDRAGFRPVRTLMGNALLLTDGPKDVDPEGTQALVIVAPALGQVPVAPGQESAFARKALGTIREVRDIVVADEDRATRDGAVVIRLRGTGKDVRSGREVGVIQTIRFAEAGYLRVIGLAGADRPDILARAERIAASVAPRGGQAGAP
ncbi:hypothetical protein ASF49_21375 [Methylobacterium sp. Leaf104]|uniref:hypothetical protein n=1 Tax=Methylobacterium TaxID=407 RepID=UPI0006F1CA07|nr:MULTISPECIES: hypothetical protein [Methylobacterium]KQP40081.1 hypothetical protein ASF49_21375 [Methylobacterium sp. Leaf104]MCI9881940.1 hypothetical protein [Methylobacterium goesingense]